MEYLDKLRDRKLADGLVKKIRTLTPKRHNFMEVCGTHTVTILKSGIKDLLRDEINLISGPGCPVCVTSTQDVDKAISIARMDGVILATFGDMLKVPGSSSSLQREKAEGRNIRVIYSSLDALKIARENPKKMVVLLAIGFETTAPTIASTLLTAIRMGLSNFSILSLHKLIPPAMKALLGMGEIRLEGFICPGHVGTIIGSTPFQFIAKDYGIPCVITGFEPLDILQAIFILLTQKKEKKSQVMIQYKRAVSKEGNPVALDLMDKVFERCDAKWRGLRTIPESGLRLRDKYKNFDGEYLFDIRDEEVKDPSGCICGEILRGIKEPIDCKLFGRSCRPYHPVGPCMVSSEGSCAAYYHYGRKER
ncbi:MAG: hydrogenase formation protein HypD [Deltaproteobacteria bacterium]|nr:hydrogenase formation protein HypD [Deltaproteobacteria bacterium]